MRLVGGRHPNEGRVEVMYDETQGWGTVCDSTWDNFNAKVVCRELGLPFASAQAIANPYHNDSDPHFGRGSGQIWLTNIDCDGWEENLDECANDGWGNVAECNHTYDASVICNGMYNISCDIISNPIHVLEHGKYHYYMFIYMLEETLVPDGINSVNMRCFSRIYSVRD